MQDKEERARAALAEMKASAAKRRGRIRPASVRPRVPAEWCDVTAREVMRAIVGSPFPANGR
jgi:hypothetical protein